MIGFHYPSLNQGLLRPSKLYYKVCKEDFFCVFLWQKLINSGQNFFLQLFLAFVRGYVCGGLRRQNSQDSVSHFRHQDVTLRKLLGDLLVSHEQPHRSLEITAGFFIREIDKEWFKTNRRSRLAVALLLFLALFL